jgi:hypothetical protein
MSLGELSMAKTKYKQLQAASNPDPMEIEHRGLVIEWRSAVITANANLVQIDEHLADHPWESPPLIAEVHRGVEDAPIPRRHLANPFPTPPPAPPSEEPDHSLTIGAPPAPAPAR